MNLTDRFKSAIARGSRSPAAQLSGRRLLGAAATADWASLSPEIGASFFVPLPPMKMGAAEIHRRRHRYARRSWGSTRDRLTLARGALRSREDSSGQFDGKRCRLHEFCGLQTAYKFWSGDFSEGGLSPNPLILLEATPGIEPGYADLQSAASPLRHVAVWLAARAENRCRIQVRRPADRKRP